jgi:hypothetical protein
VRWGGRPKTLRGGCQCKPSLSSREEIAEQQVTAESKGYVRYRQCRPCKADTKSSDRGGWSFEVQARTAQGGSFWRCASAAVGAPFRGLVWCWSCQQALLDSRFEDGRGLTGLAAWSHKRLGASQGLLGPLRDCPDLLQPCSGYLSAHSPGGRRGGEREPAPTQSTTRRSFET